MCRPRAHLDWHPPGFSAARVAASSGGATPQHPVQTIVRLPMHELIRPVVLSRRIGRNDDWPADRAQRSAISARNSSRTNTARQMVKTAA